ncbi:hypothetical protein [Methylobacterium aquaticum]|uniref:hypothetical protein n=1 Tax=Methylobacterium aquaticum TaxID=270351 RepID=UPI0019349A3D|nr:hypothetical protein [Methylobacterium aquaticum]QRE75482.1 hypothetical protein F1D61_19490 [Methylobacterium aquaticum]
MIRFGFDQTDPLKQALERTPKNPNNPPRHHHSSVPNGRCDAAGVPMPSIGQGCPRRNSSMAFECSHSFDPFRSFRATPDSADARW